MRKCNYSRILRTGTVQVRILPTYIHLTGTYIREAQCRAASVRYGLGGRDQCGCRVGAWVSTKLLRMWMSISRTGLPDCMRGIGEESREDVNLRIHIWVSALILKHLKIWYLTHSNKQVCRKELRTFRSEFPFWASMTYLHVLIGRRIKWHCLISAPHFHIQVHVLVMISDRITSHLSNAPRN